MDNIIFLWLDDSTTITKCNNGYIISTSQNHIPIKVETCTRVNKFVTEWTLEKCNKPASIKLEKKK